MTAGKPLTVAKPKPRKLSASQPTLCPTCLNIMRPVDDGWECPKHGKPTRP